MKRPKFLVVTGEFGTGKTLFLLKTGFPMERVLHIDMELSAYQYQHMGFDHMDIGALITEKNPLWTPTDLYHLFTEQIRTIPKDKYDAILIDTIELIETGIADWVSKNPGHFNHTANQYSAMAGVFWGDVKQLEQRLMLSLSAKCKMLGVAAHMRDQYDPRTKKPTGERERRGKEILTQLADLEITLQRGENQMIPSGTVNKQRWFWQNPENPSDIRPSLPPVLPQATWEVIDFYLENPPDWNNLKPEEKVGHKPLLTDDERLMLQAEIARAQTEVDSPPVVFLCNDCRQEIKETTVGKKTFTVDEILQAARDREWPDLCVECATKRKKKEDGVAKAKKEAEAQAA